MKIGVKLRRSSDQALDGDGLKPLALFELSVFTYAFQNVQKFINYSEKTNGHKLKYLRIVLRAVEGDDHLTLSFIISETSGQVAALLLRRWLIQNGKL